MASHLINIISNFYNLPVCTSSLGSENVLSHDLSGACPRRPPHQTFRPVAQLFAALHYNDYWSVQTAIRLNYKSAFAHYFACISSSIDALVAKLWWIKILRYRSEVRWQDSGAVTVAEFAIMWFLFIYFPDAPKTFLNNIFTYHQPIFCRCV